MRLDSCLLCWLQLHIHENRMLLNKHISLTKTCDALRIWISLTITCTFDRRYARWLAESIIARQLTGGAVDNVTLFTVNTSIARKWEWRTVHNWKILTQLA